MEIIGKWRGYYEYGLGYTLPQFGERVDISVTFEGTNDKFTGQVTEGKSEYSVPLKGEISGFSENEFISFIKRYPSYPMLKEEGKSEIIFEKGQLEIEHEGFIDSKNMSMYGGWYITENKKDELGSFEVTTQGIWMLRKVK